MLGCFGVLSCVWGFTPPQLRAIRVDAAKATYRLSRGQNAATTMMAHAQAAGAKNIDPAFRHHRQVVLVWVTGVGKARQTSTQCRRRSEGRGQAQLPQEPVVRRHGCGSHLRAHSSASGLERAVCKADLLAVAPKTVGFWVGQASLMSSDSSAHWDHSKGPLFWEAMRPLLVSGKLEGWSLWHRNVLVKLVSYGFWTQERLRRRHLLALPRRSRHNVPPLLRLLCPADRARHASLTGGAAGGTFSCAAIQGTDCTTGSL